MKKLHLACLLATLFFSCSKENTTPEQPEEQDTALTVIVKGCNQTADPECSELVLVKEAEVSAYPTRQDRDDETNVVKKLTNALGKTTFRAIETDSLYLEVSWLGLLQAHDVAAPAKVETEFFVVFPL